MGDNGRRKGEGTELCRPTEKTPCHYSQDVSTSISSVYTDALNLGILLLDTFTKRKDKVGSQIFKICFLVHFVNCVLYSAVSALLLVKGWKKPGMELNRLSGKYPKRQKKSLLVKWENYETKSQLHKQGWKDCVHILHGKVIDCFKAISAKEEYPL